MGNPRQALDRLRQAAASGDLDALCARHGVSLLVAFGSATKPGTKARDLDIAVRFSGDGSSLLMLLDELGELASTTELDVMDLRRAGPVARERALVGSEPLFEDSPGTFANEQLAAIMERLDTDWLRRLELDRLAG